MTAACRRCTLEKPLDEYYSQASYRDKICKRCRCEAGSARYRARKLEKAQEAPNGERGNDEAETDPGC
jgi:hypothetical protein